MRLAKRAVIHAVGIGLFTASWMFLVAFAVGDRVAKPIPRNPDRSGYV